MHLIIFAGTTEEYHQVAAVLHQQLGIAVPDKSAPKAETQQVTHLLTSREDDDPYVSTEEAKTILTRLPLSENMKRILTILRNAGDNPIPSSNLKSVNEHNTDQFRAMMGAFSRRVATTAGGKSFFWKEWDASNGEYNWRLPLSVRLAMNEVQVLE